jgi:hypothetical protein
LSPIDEKNKQTNSPRESVGRERAQRKEVEGRRSMQILEFRKTNKQAVCF